MDTYGVAANPIDLNLLEQEEEAAIHESANLLRNRKDQSSGPGVITIRKATAKEFEGQSLIVDSPLWELEQKAVREANQVVEQTGLISEKFNKDKNSKPKSFPVKRLVEVGGLKKLTLEWRNITFTVPDPSSDNKNSNSKFNGRKNLLTDCYGKLYPGQVAALIGPSGAGKSTLMNILASRQSVSLAEESPNASGPRLEKGSSIYYGGKPVSLEDLKDSVAFVMQHDELMPNQTVQETLEFAAKLKLPQKLIDESKGEVIKSNVEELLRKLDLWHVKDVVVGNALIKGISGGQKKRLSAAIELINRPSVIFLDEPTSGLDSHASMSLITMLKQIAREQNCIICCTIHQPSSELFDLFDSVQVLRAGKVLFQGFNGATSRFLLEKMTEAGDWDSKFREAGREKSKANTDTVNNPYKIKTPNNLSMHQNSSNPQLSASLHSHTDSTSSATPNNLTCQEKFNMISPCEQLQVLQLIQIFLSQIIRLPIPSESNPADWLLNLASSLPDDIIEEIHEMQGRVYELCNQDPQVRLNAYYNYRKFKSKSESNNLIKELLPLMTYRIEEARRSSTLSSSHSQIMCNDHQGSSGSTNYNSQGPNAFKFTGVKVETFSSANTKLTNPVALVLNPDQNLLNGSSNLDDDIDNIDGPNTGSSSEAASSDLNGPNILDANEAIPAKNPDVNNHSEIKCNLKCGVYPSKLKTMHVNWRKMKADKCDPKKCGLLSKKELDREAEKLLDMKNYSTLKGPELKGFCVQTCALFQREVTEQRRGWVTSILLRLGIPLFQIIILALAYVWCGSEIFRLDKEVLVPGGRLDEELSETPTFVPKEKSDFTMKINETSNAITNIVFVIFIQSGFAQLQSFPKERAIFLREYTANFYSISAYLASKFYWELILLILTVCLNLTTPYFMLSLNGSYSLYFVFCLVAGFSGGSVGLFLSALFPADVQTAGLIAPVVMVSLPNSVSGIFRPLPDVTPALRWVNYFIPVAWLGVLLPRAEFKGNQRLQEVLNNPGQNDLDIWEFNSSQSSDSDETRTQNKLLNLEQVYLAREQAINDVIEPRERRLYQFTQKWLDNNENWEWDKDSKMLVVVSYTLGAFLVGLSYRIVGGIVLRRMSQAVY